MWALALLLCAAPPAPLELAVVPSVVTGAAGRTTGFEVEADLRRVVAARPSLRATRLTRGLRDRVASCGADVACMVRGLAQDGYALGLRVAADQRFSPAVFTVQLVDVVRGRVVDELVGEADATTELRVALTVRVEQLLERAGHPRLARVQTAVSPREATLRLEPEPVSQDEGGYWVTEGDYQLHAAHGGHTAVSPLVAVAGRTTQVSLELSPPEAESSWLWLGIVGAVVVSAVVSIGVAAAVSGAESSCLCLGAAGATCEPCP
jgi:hypothetical protein